MAERLEQVIDNPKTDYEREDLKLTATAIAALVIVALLGLTPLILRGAYPTARNDVDRRLTVQPPAPQLQTDPEEDLRQFRARQEAWLNGYGWVDRAHDIAHIPIDEAMKQVSAEGIDGFPRAP